MKLEPPFGPVWVSVPHRRMTSVTLHIDCPTHDDAVTLYEQIRKELHDGHLSIEAMTNRNIKRTMRAIE